MTDATQLEALISAAQDAISALMENDRDCDYPLIENIESAISAILAAARQEAAAQAEPQPPKE